MRARRGGRGGAARRGAPGARAGGGARLPPAARSRCPLLKRRPPAPRCPPGATLLLRDARDHPGRAGVLGWALRPQPGPGPPDAGVLLAHRCLLHSLTHFALEQVYLPAALPQRLRLQFPGLPVGPRGAADPGGQALRLGLRGGPGAAVRGRCAGAALQYVLALYHCQVFLKRFLRLRYRGRPSRGPSLGRARPPRPGRRWPATTAEAPGASGSPARGLPDPLRFLFFGTHGFWDEILFTFLGRRTGRPAATRRSGPSLCTAAAASWWRNSTSTCTGAAAGAPGSGARLRDLPLRVGAVPGPGPPLVRRLLLGLFSLPAQFHGPHHPDVFTWLDIP
uniref:Transmembrane protein 229A n=1 Tax=Canis lupus familiaris TaxID=9615 RepID=A0A8P0TRV5_CANLF